MENGKTEKIRGQSALGFCLPHARNHPKPSNVYCNFSVLPSPTDEAVGQMFAFNTSFDVVLRKEVPLGVEKI